MKVIITTVGPFEWASRQLAESLRQRVVGIEVIAREFASYNSEKTLCVILCCPCCEGRHLDGIPMPDEKTIWVTPFHGIDHRGLDITEIDLYPPHSGVGRDEARDANQFFEHWAQTIWSALAN